MHGCAVGRREGGLHERDPLPDLRPERAEVRNDRVVEQAFEAGDPFECLHVQRIGDLVRDGFGERRITRHEHERAAQRLPDPELRLVARGQAE